MVNFKKMDEKEFVFINKTASKEEEQDFSTFLKERKLKAGLKNKSKIQKAKKKELA